MAGPGGGLHGNLASTGRQWGDICDWPLQNRPKCPPARKEKQSQNQPKCPPGFCHCPAASAATRQGVSPEWRLVKAPILPGLLLTAVPFGICSDEGFHGKRVVRPLSQFVPVSSLSEKADSQRGALLMLMTPVVLGPLLVVVGAYKFCYFHWPGKLSPLPVANCCWSTCCIAGTVNVKIK